MARKMHRLSARKVASNLEPGYYCDGGGLYMQVSPTGSKSWIFRFMRQTVSSNGKPMSRDMGLGSLLGISLAEAREKAADCRRLLANRIDPIDARDSGRARPARNHVAGDASNTAFCMKRGEQKYQISGAGDLQELRREVERYIPLYEYTPGRGTTIVDSLYFDNDARELFRPRNSNGEQTHVRLRSYRYKEDASDDGSAPEYWMETKIKNGVVTKHRFRISKKMVYPFLRGDDVEREVLAANRGSGDKAAVLHAYAKTRALLQGLDLKPVLLVRFRRTAFQNSSERLSLDWDIGYFPISGGGPHLPVAGHIAAAREKFPLLEIKYPVGAFPVWMDSLQDRCRMVERRRFSKFDRGMLHLSRAMGRNLSTQDEA